MEIKNAKLLMVGAGGIGCELLKNLVLTGFTQIELIDLDTIELSNLNRQFLFQKIHVGKPKAIIARESVLKYNPDANIIAHHDSIMNPKYNVDYFKQFSIVLNALDNKAARSHVNRLCLAADVPLVESGTAGYLGQVTVIKKGQTECYDCLPKPAAKTFPGCTIRNTPSEPIHCIVWAKHLFNQLFGAEDPDEAVSPDGEDPENMAGAGETVMKKSEGEEVVRRQSTRQWAKETSYDAMKLFNKLFSDDIKYLLSMAKLWEKRKAPTPLEWAECIENENLPLVSEQEKAQSNNGTSEKIASHKLWSIKECCEMFSESVGALRKKLEESSGDGDNPILVWDKDDEEAMNFVTAASNLRCFIFSIPVKTKFETKSLAGNIIPAIATTNAIVAGLIVLEAFKILKNRISECKMVFLRETPGLSKLFVNAKLPEPNERCYVCASKPEISVKLNLKTFTIKQFEVKILKQELNMIQPDVEVDDGSGRIIISSEEGETEENNDKTLAHFGLQNQSALKCDDFFQNFQIKINLIQCEQFDASNTKEYEVTESQKFLEYQEELEKEKNNNKNNNNQEEAIGEEKKRTYDKAFEEDGEKTEAEKAKKLKASEEVVDSDEILCESNSINDASEALSDEESAVEPKPAANLVDDEIIIEDSSNEANGKEDLNGNGTDEDVIECSSEDEDDDIIELNDDEIEENSHNANTNQSWNNITNTSVNYKKLKLLEANGVRDYQADVNNEHKNGHENSTTNDDDIQVLE